MQLHVHTSSLRVYSLCIFVSEKWLSVVHLFVFRLMISGRQAHVRPSTGHSDSLDSNISDGEEVFAQDGFYEEIIAIDTRY